MLLACAVMGAGMAIVSTYLFIFLQAELAAPKVLLGISITITVITEIPLFNNSDRVHALLSPQNMVAAAMVGWALRCICYSILTDAWWVLAIEPFHGLTFGLAWLAGVHVVTTSYPPELAASAFGSLHAFMFGGGHIVGMVVGGYGYDWLGPYVFFRVCAVVMLCFAAFFVAIDRAYAARTLPAAGGDEATATTAVGIAAEAAVKSAAPMPPPSDGTNGGDVRAAPIVGPSQRVLGMTVSEFNRAVTR